MHNHMSAEDFAQKNKCPHKGMDQEKGLSKGVSPTGSSGDNRNENIEIFFSKIIK